MKRLVELLCNLNQELATSMQNSCQISARRVKSDSLYGFYSFILRKEIGTAGFAPEMRLPMKEGHRDPEQSAVRVLVADSSRIHSRLVADALRRDPGLAVIPCDSELSGAAVAVAVQDIDVLVISANIDEHPGQGLEILQQLSASHTVTRSVLLLDSSKDEAVVQAFRAGARGVFGRNDPIELLNKCVRCVHQGQIWANSHQLEVAMAALAHAPALSAINAAGINLLSARELEVVGYLAEGLTNREIAKRMNLSQHTVKNYLFRVFDKLGVSSRVELLFMTLSHAKGQVSPPPSRTQSGDSDAYTPAEVNLLKQSAEAGAPGAQLALAELYVTRRDAPRDLVEAYVWYTLATERALHARQSLMKRMTPQQIEESKRMADMWLAKQKIPSASMPTLSLQPKPPAAARAEA